MAAGPGAAMAAGPGAGGEFVEGWLVAQLLGEGAYGEVRLLVHARSGACVALKVSRGARAAAAAREAALQRALRHPHVVRCLGARAHASAHYTFLEYVPGGELFQRIRPDVGMPAPRARRYLAHALHALRYLHARGVAHRDLKPENMLIDAGDNLKLSDFGMATLFRHGARERLLTRVCGTLPYAAPEVLAASAQRPYRAPPADVWALAVVLVAMLAGELAWERAHDADARYAAWTSATADAPPAAPWSKVRGAARALLRRALRPEPERRATLPQLLQHRWLAGEDGDGDAPRAWRSQPTSGPAPPPPAPAAAADLSPADMDALISYSQPTRAADLLLVAGAGTQDATQATAPGASEWARLTRVAVRGAREQALRGAARALAGAGMPAAVRADGATLTVECGADVQMRAWAVPGGAGAGGDTLLEFRRARGCGLAFQRRFRDVRRALAACAPVSAPASASASASASAPAHAESMDVL